jgi:hypothetical protein
MGTGDVAPVDEKTSTTIVAHATRNVATLLNMGAPPAMHNIPPKEAALQEASVLNIVLYVIVSRPVR